MLINISFYIWLLHFLSPEIEHLTHKFGIEIKPFTAARTALWKVMESSPCRFGSMSDVSRKMELFELNDCLINLHAWKGARSPQAMERTMMPWGGVYGGGQVAGLGSPRWCTWSWKHDNKHLKPSTYSQTFVFEVDDEGREDMEQSYRATKLKLRYTNIYPFLIHVLYLFGSHNYIIQNDTFCCWKNFFKWSIITDVTFLPLLESFLHIDAH